MFSFQPWNETNSLEVYALLLLMLCKMDKNYNSDLILGHL